MDSCSREFECRDKGAEITIRLVHKSEVGRQNRKGKERISYKEITMKERNFCKLIGGQHSRKENKMFSGRWKFSKQWLKYGC